jgi:hypothetical protein
MKHKSQAGFAHVGLIFLLIVVVGIVGGGGYYIWHKNHEKKTSDNSQTERKTAKITNYEECVAAGNPVMESYPTQCAANGKTFVNKDQKAAVAGVGYITGRASYPSERLADDEKICAENVGDRATVSCVDVGSSQTINYRLKVPAGNYYVYSVTDNRSGYKAYYNEFVTCGLSVECPESGHKKLIAVNIEAGKMASGVDPGDWYDNSL